MKRIAVSLVMLGLLFPSSSFAQSLSGEEIVKLLRGHLAEGTNPEGVEFTIDYGYDWLRGWVGELTDRGEWWVEGDKFCFRWENWQDHETLCRTAERDGDELVFYKEDGSLSSRMRIVE